MFPKSAKLLEDMRRAASDVLGFAAGRSLADYTSDALLRYAVERGLEVVGEALTQLERYEPELAQRVTNYDQVIRFRNVLAHGYNVLKPDKVWDVVEQHLPLLKREVEALLAEVTP